MKGEVRHCIRYGRGPVTGALSVTGIPDCGEGAVVPKPPEVWRRHSRVHVDVSVLETLYILSAPSLLILQSIKLDKVGELP
jgi:hypothetical protein